MKIVNSFDTWHGTKNVGKQMKKISEGCKRDINKTCFPELSDKRKSIKLHLYWAMKNCGYNPETLKDMIENILCHYLCFHNSPCKTPDYSPSKVPIQEAHAAKKLLDTLLQDTYIYKMC